MRYTIAFPFADDPCADDIDSISEAVEDSISEAQVRAKVHRRARHRADRYDLARRAVDTWRERREL